MKKTSAHPILLAVTLLASIAPFCLAYAAQPADNKPKPAPLAAPMPPKPGFNPGQVGQPPAVPAVAAPLLASVTAVTEKPTTNPTVTAGGVSWQCAASQCSRSAPVAFITPESCHALAQQVGRIRSFGSAAKQLDAAQLTQCNQGILTIATGLKTETRVATGFAGGPIAVETNFIAKAKTPVMPGAAAGTPAEGGAIAIETNFIARPKAGSPSARASGDSPGAIAIETNFIARPKTATSPMGAAAAPAAGATPIDVQVNYIARPKGR